LLDFGDFKWYNDNASPKIWSNKWSRIEGNAGKEEIKSRNKAQPDEILEQ